MKGTIDNYTHIRTVLCSDTSFEDDDLAWPARGTNECENV